MDLAIDPENDKLITMKKEQKEDFKKWEVALIVM